MPRSTWDVAVMMSIRNHLANLAVECVVVYFGYVMYRGLAWMYRWFAHIIDISAHETPLHCTSVSSSRLTNSCSLTEVTFLFPFAHHALPTPPERL